MFLSLNDFFNDDSSNIQVDSSGLDVSEFEAEDDKAFLIEHGQEILRIRGKAAYAKEQIAKAIDARSEDAQGRHIYEIQERFRNTPELKGGLFRYFHSIGFWNSQMERQGLKKPEPYIALNTAFNWANAYRAALEMKEKLAGLYSPEEIQEKVAALPTSALAKAYSGLSEADRETVYLKAMEGGMPSQSEVKAMVKSPEAKLSKARDMLKEAQARAAAAQERLAEVKADDSIPSQVDGQVNPEYAKAASDVNNSKLSVANFERKIAELEALLAEKDSEIDRLQFDENTIRDQRMRKTANALLATLPSVQADIQKFYSDIQYYDSDVVTVLEDHIKTLNSYITAHL